MAHAVRRRARERRRTARLAADREVSERRVYVQTPGRIVNVLIRKEFGGRISSGAGEGAKPHDMNVGAIDAVRAIGAVLREHGGLVARDQREVDGGAESGSRQGVD